MGRATIKDVAREAGVSMSTVNKALTGKSGISQEMKQHILDTAKRLDYRVNRVAGSLARNTVRVGIVIPSDWAEYYKDICDGIACGMERLADWKVEGVTLVYTVSEEDAGQKKAFDCFQKLKEQDVNAVIFCHSNYGSCEEALGFAAGEGMDVVCVGLGSGECPQSVAVIEVDAYKCGRIGAELLEWGLPDGGKTAIVIGSSDIWPHKEKVRGFCQRLSEGSKLQTAAILEAQDEEDTAYGLVSELLRKEEISGIYIATGAVKGVCRAVADSGKSGKIRLVATDLSGECRNYLEEKMVSATIYQSTFEQGELAVDMLCRHLLNGEKMPGQTYVSPVIYTKESLPAKKV